MAKLDTAPHYTESINQAKSWSNVCLSKKLPAKVSGYLVERWIVGKPRTEFSKMLNGGSAMLEDVLSY